MAEHSARYTSRQIVAMVAITMAAVAVLGIGAMWIPTYTIFERPHREFLRKIGLGMTEAQVEARVGEPRKVLPFGERDEALGQFGPHMYWHTWEGRGAWPDRFDHVAIYQLVGAWGEHLFYDDKGLLICIVSGRT